MGSLQKEQDAGSETLHQASAPDSAKTGEVRGVSWASMLAWIGLAFLVAGIVAYRLVMPFFQRH